MKRLGLLFKLAAIWALIVLLMIPLSIIEATVSERQHTAKSVQDEIARSAYGAQVLSGPFLAVPYIKRVEVEEYDQETKKRVRVEREVSGQILLAPQQLTVNGNAETEVRYRGIYPAHLYNANLMLEGQFQWAANNSLAEPQRYRWGIPRLLLAVDDVRGIKRVPQLQIDGQAYTMLPGTEAVQFAQGVHALLTEHDITQAGSFKFKVDLRLGGMQRLEFVPSGVDTHITLQAAWPHPSFNGTFLPEQRQITESGFSADWQTSHFATAIEQRLRDCEVSNCNELREMRFGVAFIQPVDVYQQTSRALKYALLFILPTFALFFLFEVLRGLAIHPMQYLLVGCALAMFYLLLLSLAEHINFLGAYLAAAAGCVGVISVYLGAVFGGWQRGLGAGVILAGLYGLLYAVLGSEDYALLMGSLLLFGLLALGMYATRHVDWYRVGQGLARRDDASANKPVVDAST